MRMSVDQTDSIDFASVDEKTGDLWLTISDHLPWGTNESEHLFLLQNKLNAYIRFIESGEVFRKVPEATNNTKIVINLVFKFPPNESARTFLTRAHKALDAADIKLQFSTRP